MLLGPRSEVCVTCRAMKGMALEPQKCHRCGWGGHRKQCKRGRNILAAPLFLPLVGQTSRKPKGKSPAIVTPCGTEQDRRVGMGQTGIGPVQGPGLLQLSVYSGLPTNGFQPVGVLVSHLLSPVNAAVAQVMVCSGSLIAPTYHKGPWKVGLI